jgi:hypothetical protein
MDIDGRSVEINIRYVGSENVYNTSNTYTKNSYMLEHPGAILRELL